MPFAVQNVYKRKFDPAIAYFDGGEGPVGFVAPVEEVLLKFDKIAKVPTTHVCSRCGSCCRNFDYIPLSQDDIETLENFTALASPEFTENIDKTGEKRFMKFQENGDCIFLNTVDGAYSCSVYEARPATCRDYPSTDIQRETCRVYSGRRK